jgi:hypothetical protein
VGGITLLDRLSYDNPCIEINLHTLEIHNHLDRDMENMVNVTIWGDRLEHGDVVWLATF